MDISRVSLVTNLYRMLFVLRAMATDQAIEVTDTKNPKKMYTLNTVEQHSVCYAMQRSDEMTKSDVVSTQSARQYKGATDLIVYGIDRASFNQGQNAQFDFSVEEEKAQTIVSKGVCGGGTDETVGALCARDYKGVGSQYVNEGKCIIQCS